MTHNINLRIHSDYDLFKGPKADYPPEVATLLKDAQMAERARIEAAEETAKEEVAAMITADLTPNSDGQRLVEVKFTTPPAIMGLLPSFSRSPFLFSLSLSLSLSFALSRSRSPSLSRR